MKSLKTPTCVCGQPNAMHWLGLELQPDGHNLCVKLKAALPPPL